MTPEGHQNLMNAFDSHRDERQALGHSRCQPYKTAYLKMGDSLPKLVMKNGSSLKTFQYP